MELDTRSFAGVRVRQSRKDVSKTIRLLLVCRFGFASTAELAISFREDSRGFSFRRTAIFWRSAGALCLTPVRAKNTSQPRQYQWSSYQATAGRTQAHPCLTADEILGHFGQRRGAGQEKYRDFVQDGIGSDSIWEELEAQSLLGVEGFAEGLRHLVREKQQIREIPKGQRFAGRPTLEKLFSHRRMSKTSRDQVIARAGSDYGYSQIELANFLNLHSSTISRILAEPPEQQK